ncbi:MAG: right-handed parallel beta-helix repeat-containing protein [Gammaproteobacteria bacterium]|nr:right-handed parallel beta-helix repeat-containing protein [Gammaproteobacteria bacterium]
MPERTSSSIRVLGPLLAVITLLPAVGHAVTLYADNTLSGNCASSYDSAARSCSGGSAAGYATLAAALAAAQPGDVVRVRGGTWSERLVPTRSGTAAAPITIIAQAGETPTLSGISDVAIHLANVNYLIIDGLAVNNAVGWARIDNANYNVLRNLRLTRATAGGTTGGVKFANQASYNKLLDSVLDDGNDNLTIQEADHNLIAGNTISEGRHSIFSVRCGNNNVLRNNTFSNTQQKIGEIYDCEGTSDAPVKLDATKRNLVDGNRFTYTHASSRDYDYNGIQYAGQNGIVRRNVFYDNQGGGINFQVYSDESLYNYGNRVYHNTFFNNRCYGIAASGSSTSTRYRDNRVRDNLLYKNVGCAGQSAQTGIGNSGAVILDSNAIVTVAPPFVNEATHDLHLQSGSSLLDTGAFLTTTTAAGSGTSITVADASWFYDGYQISGELGDVVQLEGQTQTARIVAINYATNTLTLGTSLSWSSGQGLHLAYSGGKPDPGAYESGLARVQPSAPTNLRVQ